LVIDYNSGDSLVLNLDSIV